MATSFSIKNVPDDLAVQLRSQAAANHRSIQGELMSILQDGVRKRPTMTPMQVYEHLRARGIRSESTSVEMIREDRDSR